MQKRPLKQGTVTKTPSSTPGVLLDLHAAIIETMFQTETDVKEPAVRAIPVELGSSTFYAPKKILLAVFVSLGYLLVSKLLIGYKADQLMLVVLFNTMYFFKPATRRLILGFSIFIIYWIIFDYMKAFPNYSFNSVNIASL